MEDEIRALEATIGQLEEKLETWHDTIEDLAGNLEDAADTIEKVAQAVYPAGTNTDVEAYRRIATEARKLLS